MTALSSSFHHSHMLRLRYFSDFKDKDIAVFFSKFKCFHPTETNIVIAVFFRNADAFTNNDILLRCGLFQTRTDPYFANEAFFGIQMILFQKVMYIVQHSIFNNGATMRIVYSLLAIFFNCFSIFYNSILVYTFTIHRPLYNT